MVDSMLESDTDLSELKTEVIDISANRVARALTLLKTFVTDLDDENKRLCAVNLVEALDLLETSNRENYTAFLKANSTNLLMCLRFFMMCQSREFIAALMNKRTSKHFSAPQDILIRSAYHLGKLHLLTQSKHIDPYRVAALHPNKDEFCLE